MEYSRTQKNTSKKNSERKRGLPNDNGRPAKNAGAAAREIPRVRA
jgi:hypothetical protein